MKNAAYFKGKKVVIAGFARSGLACANLLYSLCAAVSITDSKSDESIRRTAASLASKDINIELGKHTKEFVLGNDILVISPGVPNEALPVVWAKGAGIQVISEIELAWMLCPATVIAITGTNGKTTVTTLIGRILEASGKNAFVCGNIGNPFSGEVEKMREGDFVSLEVSSFQLENIATFKPKVAVILNLSRNHLDRYKDMREYLEAKKRIFVNQDNNDHLVLNSEAPEISALAGLARAKVSYFSRQDGLDPNQSVVMEVGSILGIDKEIILRVFREFKGVEHRMELVTEINNVKFINDSKATTVDAAIWALNNSSPGVVLIAGGREKGNDYSLISGLVRQKVKRVIVIGEAKERIKDAFAGITAVEEALTLESAVEKAHAAALPGENVLFSPMCKSFDMFDNYEHRGMVFKKAALGLIKRKV